MTDGKLNLIPYLNENGCIPEEIEGKIGVYGIFDREKVLQLVSYSRNVYLSLKQHLVRQPQKCYWFKLQTIDRPSRTVLEEIQKAWIEENQFIPPGNNGERAKWNESIDTKLALTDEEREMYDSSEERQKIALLKKVARREEAKILKSLEERGVQMNLRFNPKLKEQGLLDLK
ncbi:MAG: GIY-YIG nuclease family protein [Cyanobacteriota bacterium]|nr:GIY-YIG nuclease family protein [Cyanobacteriota bacterium]